MEELHPREWIDRCSTLLQEHHSTVEIAQLDDVAIELWGDVRLRSMSPEDAAVQWLESMT